MIPIPTGVRVWLATGYTDMRKGFPGLSLQVQEVLRRDPLGGHLFCFRGRRSDLLKVIWHDGQGACLFTTAGAMAIGCRRGGDDLDGTDELSSVRNRLAPSPRKLASDECRMRVLGLKELANVIHSLYAIEACRPPFGSCRRPRDDHGGAGCTGEGRSPCDGCLQ
jgi:hypothetical protein